MEPPNVSKVQLHEMSILYNVRMKLLNVKKKKRKPPNVTKILSNEMLVLPNVTINHQM